MKIRTITNPSTTWNNNCGIPSTIITLLAPSKVRLQRRQWHPTPVLLPGKPHERRSLVGCSAWGWEESYTTARLHFHFSLSCIGEGDGNPLRCSCLENPRDEGAWWAAVYGVAQSQTRLKWLSSSSSKVRLLLAYVCMILTHNYHLPHMDAMLSHFSRVRLCATP